RLPEDPRVAPPEDLSVVCRTADEVRAAVRALGGRPVVLKAPFSTAGRDRRRALDEAWVERTLAAQGSVVVEPWLDRLVDLSVQLDQGRPTRWARFFTTPAGQYRGAWLGSPGAGLAPEVRRFLYDDGRDARWIDRAFAAVAGALAPSLDGYPSPVGVDGLIYRRADGLRLLPLLEINPRTTMGR